MDRPDASADEIRREMRRIRCHMIREVDELVDDARELTSWRYYVRKHPWSILSGFVALGYALVPRRAVHAADFDDLRKLAKEHLSAAASKPTATKGLVGSLIGLAGSYALRTGLNLASQQMGRWFHSHSGAESSQGTQRPDQPNREATRP